MEYKIYNFFTNIVISTDNIIILKPNIPDIEDNITLW